MVTRDSPPVGLDHPTVNPRSNDSATRSGHARSDTCECNDCEYTVEIADGLPPTCPNCGGALTLVGS